MRSTPLRSHGLEPVGGGLFKLASHGMACAQASPQGFSQGTFQNLGFEDADLSAITNPDQITDLPFSQLFPGWVGYFNGTNLASTALYNGVSLGAPLISLISRDARFYSNSVIA